MAERAAEEHRNQDGRRALVAAVVRARASGQVAAPGCRRAVEAALNRAPVLSGAPIRIRFGTELRAWRGRLLSGGQCGEEVHAGAHLRRREIVLDAALLARPGELARILLHELFHFVWLRAGNPARFSYEDLLRGEARRGARGELGWSAEQRKPALRGGYRSRRWREYACESFCDTAAWLLSGCRRHPEFTLAPRFRRARRAWFEAFLSRGTLRM